MKKNEAAKEASVPIIKQKKELSSLKEYCKISLISIKYTSFWFLGLLGWLAEKIEFSTANESRIYFICK